MTSFQDFLILYFPFCSWPIYNFVFDPSPFLTQTWKLKKTLSLTTNVQVERNMQPLT